MNLNYYKFRIALLAFVITFIAFLLYVMLEDYFWIEKMLQAKGSIRFKLGRVFIGLSFASITGIIIFIAMNYFHQSLNKLSYIIAGWTQNLDEDELKPDNSEIGDLIRSLRIAIYNQKNREEELFKEILAREKQSTAEEIQKMIYDLSLNDSPGLEVAALPRSTSSPECDYIQIAPVHDGCIGIMAGFPENGPLQTAYKSRLSGIFSMIEENDYKKSSIVLENILNSIHKAKIDFLNLTLFHINSISGEVKMMNFQEQDIYIIDDTWNTLPTHHSNFYNFSENSSFQSFHLEKENLLIITSDRISRSLMKLKNEDTITLLENLDNSQNATKTAIHIVKKLEEILETRFSDPVFSRFGLIVIKRL